MSDTEGGKWLRRAAEIHRCDMPQYHASDIAMGDVWQCDTCHTKWRVTGFDGGPPWDPFDRTVIKWKQVQEHSSIYAPGTK